MTFMRRRELQLEMEELAKKGYCINESILHIEARIEANKSQNTVRDLLALDQLEEELEGVEKRFSEADREYSDIDGKVFGLCSKTLKIKRIDPSLL